MKSLLPLIAVLVCLAGCQRSDHVRTAPVTGVVTLDGQPVEEGTGMFERTGARPAAGQIRKGQIVEVTTYRPNDGAPVGEHRVAVFVTMAAKSAVSNTPGGIQKFDPNYMGGGSLIPARYNDPATSQLTATINASGPNEVKFELLSK